jgi:histidine ammonia-lyase
VHGCALAALATARAAVEVELAAACDNPLVVAADGEVLPNGNFHAGALALAVSGLALALHGVAAASAARVTHLLDERSSGLPATLSPGAGTPAGLAPLQKSAAALVLQMRRLAAPVTLDATDAAQGVEDLTAPALQAIADTAVIVERLPLLLAIELVCAAQAVELRGTVDELGPRTADVYRLVRRHVEPLGDERATGPDVDRLAAALAPDQA